eukprot:gene1295-11379_t
MKKFLLEKKSYSKLFNQKNTDISKIKLLLSKNEPETAFHYFKKIQPVLQPFQKLTLYSQMIQNYIKLNQMKEAMKIYDDMMSTNIQPDCFIYNTLLEAFVKRNDKKNVEFIEELFQKNKISKNSFTFSLLIFNYLEDEKKVENFIQQIEEGGIELDSRLCFNLIIFYAKYQKIVKMYETFELMLEKKFFINQQTFQILIKKLSIHKHHSLAKKVYQVMIQLKTSPSVQVFSDLILNINLNSTENFELSRYFFIECLKYFNKNDAKVQEIAVHFIKIYIFNHRNVELENIFRFENFYGIFITQLLDNNIVDKATELLEKNFNQENMAQFLIHFSKKEKKFHHEFEQFYENVSKISLKNYSTIVHNLINSENFDTLRTIFLEETKLNEKNLEIELFNIYLNYLFSKKNFIEMQYIFDLISEKGLKLNTEAKVFFVQLKFHKNEISEAIEYMQKEIDNQNVLNLMLEYLTRTNYDESLLYFENMNSKNDDSYNIMFKSITKYSSIENIKEFYNSIDKPSNFIIKSFIFILCEEDQIQEAIEIAKEKKKFTFFEPILKYYITVKREYPEILVRYMKENNHKLSLNIYLSMIDMFMSKRFDSDVLSVYEEMKNKGMNVNSETHQKLLKYFYERQQFKSALKIIKGMEKEKFIEKEEYSLWKNRIHEEKKKTERNSFNL